jgi:hypothetical protein
MPVCPVARNVVFAAAQNLFFNSQRGIHFAARAVSAHWQHAFTATFAPAGNRVLLRRMANIKQIAAQTVGQRFNSGTSASLLQASH